MVLSFKFDIQTAGQNASLSLQNTQALTLYIQKMQLGIVSSPELLWAFGICSNQ